MKTISSEEIKHLASLSQLEFTEDQIETFKGEFNGILNLVNQIATAKTEKVNTFAREISVEELREDIPVQSYSQEVLLKNAPKQRKGHFNVPKVVE